MIYCTGTLPKGSSTDLEMNYSSATVQAQTTSPKHNYFSSSWSQAMGKIGLL